MILFIFYLLGVVLVNILFDEVKIGIWVIVSICVLGGIVIGFYICMAAIRYLDSLDDYRRSKKKITTSVLSDLFKDIDELKN